MDERQFYLVEGDLARAPLRDHLWYGYESGRDFRDALKELRSLWKGRTGECIDRRNGFMHLRFHDTPGGRPDEAWLPGFMLQAVPVPEYILEEEVLPSEVEQELDEALGFD